MTKVSNGQIVEHAVLWTALVDIYYYQNCHGGVVVQCPPRVREVAGSIPGRVIPNTFKEGAALIGAQGCMLDVPVIGFFIKFKLSVIHFMGYMYITNHVIIIHMSHV